MKLTRRAVPLALALLAGLASLGRSDDPKGDVKETAIGAPHGVAVKVRMEGPYTADVPLQVVCYFKYTPERARRMNGAPVELDRRLGGVIAALRERGEFAGEPLETLLLAPPGNAIPAKALLLVGLGEEDALSLELMQAVGRVSLREAARLGVRKVAFAPLLRDQGTKALDAGAVATAVVRGMLLAYDTEKRLQKEGLGTAFTLDVWQVEAGPAFFDGTVTGVRTAVAEAEKAIAGRGTARLLKGK